MKIQIVATIILGMALQASAAKFAGQDRGGADTGRLEASTIQFLLEKGTLKKSMLHYLDTLDIEQVTDPLLKDLLTELLQDDILKKDILSENNYVASENCQSSESAEVPASTQIGDRGGKICFDVPKIAAAYAGLSSEEGLIRLASLAFHEHIHHFQNPADRLEENEAEAYLFSSYVMITAKVEQEPVLRWSLATSKCENRKNGFYADPPTNLDNHYLLLNPIVCFEKQAYRIEVASFEENLLEVALCKRLGYKSYRTHRSAPPEKDERSIELDSDGKLLGFNRALSSVYDSLICIK